MAELIPAVTADLADSADFRAFLCVEPFVADFAGARALSGAFDLGVIDDLADHRPSTRQALQQRLRHEPRGLALLLDMLRAGGVVEEGAGGLRLSPAFTTALAYRDLLLEKLAFAHIVAPDFHELFTLLITDQSRFFERARLFRLFSYQNAQEPTAENLAATARWVRITTALTRYEAAACLAHYDFSRHRRHLDVGGNSGEFALRICRRHPQLRSTVFDLPVVCELGRQHVAAQAEGPRIDFAVARKSGEALPPGYDLITFKSMLHDWPEANMLAFLEAACKALAPGGTLLIYERGEVEIGPRQIAYGQIPLMLFFRSYRAPQVYAQALERLGMTDIRVQSILLETPFILLTAVKPA